MFNSIINAVTPSHLTMEGSITGTINTNNIMNNQVSWEYMEERVLEAEMTWSRLLYKSNKKLSKYRKEVFKLRKQLCKKNNTQ